eukprot:GEMP01047691.1.p1 GENE.GEMP01047691.1~~GEMP01047691.1.p1  ORF type:complete len:356 (+),score=70.37 GEMP01047691.1:60-1127(+)
MTEAINFRSKGRHTAGVVQKGTPSVQQGVTVASIPSKLETVLYHDERENMGFGSHSLRFEEDRDERPGPGSYATTKHFSQTAESDSFGRRGSGGFASRTLRFRRGVCARMLVPGPGAYDAEKLERKHFGKRRQTRVFEKPNNGPPKLFGRPPRCSPGPGTYTTKDESASTNVCASSFKSKFGQQTGVWEAPPGPGPTTYFVDQQLQKRVKESAVFKPPSTRKVLSVHPDLPVSTDLYDKEGDFVRQCGTMIAANPGPGAYDVIGVVDNGFSSKGSSMFQSKIMVPRHKELIDPGPGLYEPPLWPKRHLSSFASAFRSETERQQGSMTAAPGPAFYEVGVPDDRKSFHLNVQKRWV